MNRFVCLHGHFYQPPRENPWLEEVELQDSAYPYHDWNDRITAECYAPNGASRIIDNENRIIDIVNNYSSISFNFGPTLISWLENHAPDMYQNILEADKESMEKFSGHGAAIAQAYNHMIMPLANPRDKKTQVIWGIKDFEKRFNRKPEGMWLPETAVDGETLKIMAENGIKFTILAPRQASKIRKTGTENWEDVSGERVDMQRSYFCNFPTGGNITIFFYDGRIAQDISFSNLLENGNNLANRLLNAFPADDRLRIVHAATDGETFGHHHKFGDMALAYCLNLLNLREDVDLTVYGEYMERFPPEYEVQIFDNSSWSCVHGVERWRNNCGCNTGAHQGWTQEWRAPLRIALDRLRDELIPVFENEGGKYFKNPWDARDNYINVINDRTPENVEQFFASYTNHQLSKEEKNIALRLLEMQRHAMLMFTSCGWFFDEISGIESTQVLFYASRAMQLSKLITGKDLEPAFIEKLREAPSNIPEFQNGGKIYEMFIAPSSVDVKRVAAHYAISSVFQDVPEKDTIFCYRVNREYYYLCESGHQLLAIGKITITSDITWLEEHIIFAVLHLGGHNIIAGIENFENEESFQKIQSDLKQAFEKANIAQTINLINKQFDSSYSLWHLFRDRQREVFTRILTSSHGEIESYFRQITEHNYSIIKAMKEMNVPLPKSLSTPVEFTLNSDLSRTISEENINIGELKGIVNQFRELSVEPDRTTISFIAGETIRKLIQNFYEKPDDISFVNKIDSIFKILSPLGLEINLWRIQNIYHQMMMDILPGMIEKSSKNDPTAIEWVGKFVSLGDNLSIRVNHEQIAPVHV